MSSRILVTVVAILVAGSGLSAPRLKPEKKDAPALAGTSWAGKTAEGWDMTIDFAAEGKMTVSYNGASYTRASWKQDGDSVHYEMNDRFCEFNGKFVGDAIDGETHNVRGRKWSTKLTRIVRDK